jgi:hypothetical protein
MRRSRGLNFRWKMASLVANAVCIFDSFLFRILSNFRSLDLLSIAKSNLGE